MEGSTAVMQAVYDGNIFKLQPLTFLKECLFFAVRNQVAMKIAMCFSIACFLQFDLPAGHQS